MKQLLFIIIFTHFNVFSQQSDFVWFKAVEQTEISEELKNNDAIYIYDHLAYNYLGNYHTSITIMQKIKILSKEGLNRYSQTYIPANIYPYVQTFSARTIKEDGTVYELKQDQVVREGISNNRNDNYYNYAKFVMSGLEIGDEFEIIVRADYPGIYLGGDLILRGPLYSLRSKISITNYLNMDLGVISSAELSGFKTETNESGGRVFVWEENNLHPLERENYSIPLYETSFLSFSARFNSIFESERRREYTWFNFASELNAKYEKKKLSGRLIKSHKAKYDWYTDGSLINVKIYEILKVVNSISDAELDADDYYSFSDYLSNNKIDNEGRVEFLIAYFDRLSIPFYIGMTRDKYDGLISEKMANSHQLKRLFLAVEVSNSIYYIFPTIGRLTLYLNEIPPIYEGNNAILVKRCYSGGDQKISFIDLPISDHKNNYRKSKVLFKLNLIEKIIEVDRIDLVSGVFSYYDRYNKEYLSTNELKTELGYDSLRIDNFNINHQLLETVYPVKTKVNSQYRIKNSLIQISDSLYSIKMNDILTMFYYEKSKEQRKLDFFPLFLFEDHSSVYIESNFKISHVNAENLQTELDNEFINFELKFLQVTDYVIKVDASIKIKKYKLESVEYGLYLKFIEKIEALKKSNLIFSIN